jgi:hypothetical protein
MTEDIVPVLTEEKKRESDAELDPDLDPLVRGGTDPGIRIRTKMSRIPNTGFFAFDFVFLQIFLFTIRR